MQIVGPTLGKNLPPAWREVVDRTETWKTCKEHGHWFAALVDDKVAGVGCLDCTAKPYWMGPTFVLPEFRGRGIQPRLTEARLELARQLKLPRVCTAVDLDNSTSLRNVLNCGFKVTGFDPDYQHLELEWRPK